jgi:hypothetical protein
LCAATHTNILKSRENIVREMREFAGILKNPRNLQQTIVLTSHGRGRWFEPVLDHSQDFRLIGETLRQ